jgi:elongation factor P--(R)-beta-lysine ligase
MINASPWWMPHVHADRRPFLLARNRIKAALRAWFEGQGFTEVDAACLQVSPGNEAHLHAFETRLMDTDGASSRLYLHTSPEFACKKLLAAGEPKIFTFAPVFRNRERGRLHHPEFTMLEWYRAGEPYTRLMADCTELLGIAAEETGRRAWSWNDVQADAMLPPQRVSVAQAFETFGGVQLLETISGAAVNRERLARSAAAARHRVADDDTWSDIFSRIMTRIEPKLGAGMATVLDEYPTVEAALARPCGHDPRVAERFELYVCGMELANGFGELTDAGEQRARFEAEMAEKQRVYGERYPVDEDFLAALDRMPPASGIALGFDRLAMLATGAQRIDQVLWTPVAERGT